MENSIYVGLSRQMVLRANMDVVANNIANASTPGFRAQCLLFKEYISNPKGADAPLSFVEDAGQYRSTDPGAVQVTGNQLDIALTGPGFMGVMNPDGTVGYTRSGQFQLSADGTLMTASGHAVAGQGGSPIKIPQDSSEIRFDDRGFISNQSGQIGQLMVVEFDDVQKMKALGNGLYSTDAPSKPAENTIVKQGQLEGSNVKPIMEMTYMVDALRSYQSVQQVLQSENERLRSTIQKLAGQS